MRGHLPAPHHGRMDPGPTRYTIRINGTSALHCYRLSPLWPCGGTAPAPCSPACWTSPHSSASCLTFATVQALKDGYDALYVTDAVGGRSQTVCPTSIERLAHADAVPATGLAVVTELFAAPARDVIYWYFGEVPKLTDEVGVAEAEKLAASAQGGH